MGTRSCKDDKVLGPFGISKTNLNGVLFRDLCGVLGLCSATTFFKKRSYGTWRHQRSKLLYQLDHFLVQRASLVRIIDAGRYGENLLDSDHDAIRIVIRVAKNLKKRSGMAQNFIDRGLLSCPNMKGEFVSAVFESDGLLPDRLIHAAKKTLNVRSRKNPGWFNENAELLHAAIDARNLAQDVFSRSCRPGTRGDAAVHKKLREARKLVKTLVAEAKAEWRSKRISLLGLSRAAPKEYWQAVRELNTGIIAMNPAATMIFNDSNGVPCVNNTQNEQVVKDHFERVFNLPSTYDSTVLSSIRQRDSMEHLDLEPSDEEISKAVKHAKAGKA
jgi:hypothetical protein